MSVDLSCLSQMFLGTQERQRAAVLMSAVAFQPASSLEAEFVVGPIWAAVADAWERFAGQPVPARLLQNLLTPPIRLGLVLAFSSLNRAERVEDTERELEALLRQLKDELASPGCQSKRLADRVEMGFWVTP